MISRRGQDLTINCHEDFSPAAHFWSKWQSSPWESGDQNPLWHKIGLIKCYTWSNNFDLVTTSFNSSLSCSNSAWANACFALRSSMSFNKRDSLSSDSDKPRWVLCIFSFISSKLSLSLSTSPRATCKKKNLRQQIHIWNLYVWGHGKSRSIH